MDMQQLGYFLYMEEQERKQKEQQEVNVKMDPFLEREKATTNEKEDWKK